MKYCYFAFLVRMSSFGPKSELGEVEFHCPNSTFGNGGGTNSMSGGNEFLVDMVKSAG